MCAGPFSVSLKECLNFPMIPWLSFFPKIWCLVPTNEKISHFCNQPLVILTWLIRPFVNLGLLKPRPIRLYYAYWNWDHLQYVQTNVLYLFLKLHKSTNLKRFGLLKLVLSLGMVQFRISQFGSSEMYRTLDDRLLTSVI